jgi:DNA-binding CsgD family transcriptional regulator
VSDPIRVFVAGRGVERLALADRIARTPGMVVVGDPERADAVVLSPEEWTRFDGPRASAGRSRPDRLVEGLTAREHEVLTLVADGLHNRDIAARLGVSEHTVKFHLGAIFGKLGATTRTEAVQKGVRLGVIEI